VLAHHKCAGPAEATRVYPPPSGYRVRVKRGCGQEFTRWVTPDDSDEDLLRSALLAFEN